MSDLAPSQQAGTYPVMLNVQGESCVIVGGGTVATRKLTGLLGFKARITVISPAISPIIESHLADNDLVQWEQSHYEPGTLHQYRPFLVFAATDSAATNQQVVEEARQIGALVNSAQQAGARNFNNMAVIRRPPLTIGLHTGGMSPALTRHLKAVINEVIGDEYLVLSQWLGQIRAEIREQVTPQTRRQEVYQAILSSNILLLLRSGQTEAAQRRLREIVDSWKES